jgi:hypothetical protein
MANVTGPFGLRPIGHRNGFPTSGGLVACRIGAANDDGNFYIGDPVLYSTDESDGDDPPTMPNIMLSAGTTGTIVLGAIVSFDANPDNLTLQYRADETARIAYCAMGPDWLFEIRGDGTGTYNTGDVGANAAMVDATGSTVTGLSGFQLNETTPAADGGFALHILGHSSKSDNEGAIYSVWNVCLNTTDIATGDTVGVLAA